MNTHIYPYSLIVLVVLPLVANSADLVVEENAPPGKYGSIVEAVASARDGDRIIIQNRQSGNMPWNFQNTNQLTIDKSLTLLSAANDTFFRVQGDIIVEHAPGREGRSSACATSGGISKPGETAAVALHRSIFPTPTRRMGYSISISIISACTLLAIEWMASIWITGR